MVSQEITELIKCLSGIDKLTFDKRLAKALQPFFGNNLITWVPAPIHVKVISKPSKNTRLIVDSQGNTIAFILLTDKDETTVALDMAQPPGEWSLLEKIISGLYESALRLSEARELAFIDDVTLLFNQRYLKVVLDKEIRRAERANSNFSMLFIDIDHFKSVNDNNGHMVGSELLRQISNVLQKNIRAVDYAFRYGGDEFILLLTQTNKEAAQMVGERIREQVEKSIFEVNGYKVRLTLSIGVASYPEHARTKNEIIRIADEAMYEGKNKSRNIVNVAS